MGRPLELVGIAVRREDRDRPGIDPGLFTTDAEALVSREDVDLVIEVIGGIEPARSLILAALRHGASVVTANKRCWPRTAPHCSRLPNRLRGPLLRGRGCWRHPDHPPAQGVARR